LLRAIANKRAIKVFIWKVGFTLIYKKFKDRK
jgi:phosphomannomutase